MTSSPKGRQEAAVALDARALEAAVEAAADYRKGKPYCDAIADGIRAYLSSLPAPVAAVAPVGVKALEWQKKPNSKDEFADTVCGRYEIGIVGGGYIATVRIINDGQWDDLVFAQGICAKKDAKAAAQADYEAHIRSALIAPAKPAVDLVEARTEDEWHEDDGYAVWWTWRDGDWLGEPSYIGSPLCDDWPGYHTHWTPHPAFPAALQAPATPDTQTEVEK